MIRLTDNGSGISDIKKVMKPYLPLKLKEQDWVYLSLIK